MERFFDDFARRRLLASFSGAEAFNPSIDVAETGDAIDVTAELPGAIRKTSISASPDKHHDPGREEVREGDEGQELAVERALLRLVFARDSARIQGRLRESRGDLRQGVLKVHVPEPAEAKSEIKKIEIKG